MSRSPFALLTGLVGLAAAALLAVFVVPAGATSTRDAASRVTVVAPATVRSTSVRVTLTEFHIALNKARLKPGRHAFVVRNAGTITHAFAVDGKGVKNKHTALIAPGKSATLTVTMVRGKYSVFCPVGDHRMQGMHATVRVG